MFDTANKSVTEYRSNYIDLIQQGIQSMSATKTFQLFPPATLQTVSPLKFLTMLYWGHFTYILTLNWYIYHYLFKTYNI